MLSIFSTCWHSILEVLFPSCCAACGRKLLQEEYVICSSCIDSIARTEHAILPNNGIDILFAEWMQDSKKTVNYERGAAFAYYNRERGHVLRSLIESGKFGSNPNPYIFYVLGRMAAHEYIDSDLFDDVDRLVPIPLHSRRLRQRGFNQSEWICRGMHDVLHIPIDTDHLVRIKNNSHQSRSTFGKRSANVEDIFTIRYPEEWKNQHVLLVDDVITSGATVFSSIKNTTSIRGCRVSVFALGWAHH